MQISENGDWAAWYPRVLEKPESEDEASVAYLSLSNKSSVNPDCMVVV